MQREIYGFSCVICDAIVIDSEYHVDDELCDDCAYSISGNIGSDFLYFLDEIGL